MTGAAAGIGRVPALAFAANGLTSRRTRTSNGSSPTPPTSGRPPINDAGIQHVAPIEGFPVETYDLMDDVMLRAPLSSTKRCLSRFRNAAAEEGVVGNVCSVHGHIVTRDGVAYNTTKFGLRGPPRPPTSRPVSSLAGSRTPPTAGT